MSFKTTIGRAKPNKKLEKAKLLLEKEIIIQRDGNKRWLVTSVSENPKSKSGISVNLNQLNEENSPTPIKASLEFLDLVEKIFTQGEAWKWE